MAVFWPLKYNHRESSFKRRFLSFPFLHLDIWNLSVIAGALDVTLGQEDEGHLSDRVKKEAKENPSLGLLCCLYSICISFV